MDNFEYDICTGCPKKVIFGKIGKNGGVVDGSSYELKKPKNLSFNDNNKTQIYWYTSFEAFEKKYIYIYGVRFAVKSPKTEIMKSLQTLISLFMVRYSQTIA